MMLPVQHFKHNGAPPRRMMEHNVTALKLRPVGRERGLLEREGGAARPSPFHERLSGREHDLLDLLERVGT